MAVRQCRSRAPKQLGLRARGGRGGYRAHAGRPRGRASHYVPHIRRATVTPHVVVHVTMRLVGGLPSLRRPVPFAIVQRIFRAERRRKGFRLTHYAVRGNHLHLVCEGDDTLALSRGIQRIGSRIARALNKRWQRRGRVFSDRFHGRVVTSPRDLRGVLRYVLLNEDKDRLAAGRLAVGFDEYASGVWFDGWRDVDGCIRPGRAPPWPGEPEGMPPVTEPRSWLLQTGWKRHGLLAANELLPRK